MSASHCAGQNNHREYPEKFPPIIYRDVPWPCAFIPRMFTVITCRNVLSLSTHVLHIWQIHRHVSTKFLNRSTVSACTITTSLSLSYVVSDGWYGECRVKDMGICIEKCHFGFSKSLKFKRVVLLILMTFCVDVTYNSSQYCHTMSRLNKTN